MTNSCLTRLLPWTAKLSSCLQNFSNLAFKVNILLSVLVVMAGTAVGGTQQRGLTSSQGFSNVSKSSLLYTRRGWVRSKQCLRDKWVNCVCHLQSVDCSHNEGRLKYIPEILIQRPKIWRLYFSHNKLKSIPNDNFLKNGSHVVFVDLSHNALAYISPGAFRVFKGLQTLILSNNDLTFKEVAHVFPSPKLASLYLGSMKLGPIPDGLFTAELTPMLETLNFNQSHLRHLNLSALAALPKLKNLYVEDCRLTDSTLTSCKLPALEEFSLANNVLFDLPQTCDDTTGTSLFPVLDTLVMSGNVLSELPSKYCLPSLRHLDLSGARITKFTTDMFNRGGFPNLTKLVLNSIHPIIKVEDYAFRHPKLQQLFLKYCFLTFKKVEDQAFAGTPNLGHLVFSHSQASSMTDEKFSKVFGAISNLQSLFLGNSGIRAITRNTFSQLFKLSRLYLDSNSLTDLPDGAFDDLVNLTELVMNTNELKTVRESTFSAQTLRRLKILDLSGNKFSCDCDLLWFRGFYRSHPKLFSDTYWNYTCGGDPRYPLSSFVLREQVCFFSQSTYKYIIASITILMILGILTSVVFQYRWHFRLLLYEAFKGRDAAARYRRLQEGSFVYDVFVSYASEDLPWVREHLLPELESHLCLRLCIHQRDFLVGQNIADNIVNSVESSKKVLMVFSRNFVASQWCQFELAYCLRHVMDHDDALIVTCLEPMTSLRATGAMLAVLKTTTCIQWENSPQAIVAFWGRIQLALADILVEDAL